MAKISDRLDALVCDMDGVLYRGETAVAGAPEALARLRSAGLKVLLCTNNSRATVESYVSKLERLGFSMNPAEILTSAIVTAEELSRRGMSGRSAFVVGGDGVRTALSGIGMTLLEGDEGEEADVVVVGWDTSFTWDKMRIASTAVRSGALLIATNDDATFPSDRGLWPGAGSILASIEKASGERAEVMGKPNDPMLSSLKTRSEGHPRVAMVGDRDDTDLAGARRLGWMTILVLTGVTGREEAERLDPGPDLIVDSLASLR